MTRKIISIVALISLLFVVLTGFENLTARSFEKAPVITYLIRNSYRQFSTGIHIHENGRIRLIEKANGTGHRFIFIDKVQVQRLLDMIVREQSFFSINMQDIMAFQNSRRKIADANMTHISVWCRNGSHKLSIYNFNENTPVSTDKMIRLREIVRKLEKLFAEIKRKLR